MTPENAGKWGSVESTRDTMNWGQLDTAYTLAKTNGFWDRPATPCLPFTACSCWPSRMAASC